MTISSEVRKAGPFSGNDVTTAFSFSFKVFSTADVLAVSADSLGLETDLTEGVDYTVSLNANQNANPGGTVTLTSPLATGYTLVLTSQVQNLQPTDLTNQGGFYPAVINAALDRATIQIQQLSEKVDRSAKLPITRTEDVDALLSDIVVLADNLSSVNTVAGSIGSVNTVAGVSADVTTVAGVSAQVATVAAISTDVSTVAGVASGVPTVAASAANVDTVAGSIVNVNTVSANVSSVNTVAADIADVSTVAGNIANINAAVADLPALSAKVSKTGDNMTGPLSVPAGASGAQVPQAQEVGSLANTQLGITGQVAFFARASAPTGWLKANGAEVSRTTYAALFDVIGTTFGAGDGSTTFKLPDMRGEFPRGWDDGRGVDSGRAFGSAQDTSTQAHVHPQTSRFTASYAAANGFAYTNGGGTVENGTVSTQGMTSVSGESRPRNIALLACIKY